MNFLQRCRVSHFLMLFELAPSLELELELAIALRHRESKALVGLDTSHRLQLYRERPPKSFRSEYVNRNADLKVFASSESWRTAVKGVHKQWQELTISAMARSYRGVSSCDRCRSCTLNPV
jgi:hypothetical protein